HSVFSFQDSDWPVESPFFHLPAQSRESQMRAVLQRGLPAAEDRISENFFNCNSYKYPEDIWRASWPEYLTWLGKTMGDLRKVTQELTLKNKHLVDIQRMTESKNVQVLDHYRKLAVLPLSAQSIERLAQAISPGNQYAPDLQSTPVPTPTPGSANCPPGTPMLPAKVGPISAVGLSQILAQFNHAVGPPQDLGKQVPALVDAVRAFLRLKPFREKNSEIASAILQLSLEKLGVPATHRLVWDDELSHRPEVLLKSLEEEITRRTYNADMCLFYYRYPISSGYGGLKKLLNSSDCGMVPLPAK
ncbi:MAG: hypothetical protein ACXVBW_10930, partial [Bdellovibrionota bacterium]